MKILIILAIVYLGWQLFKRYIFPLMVVLAANKVRDKVMKNMNQGSKQSQSDKSSSKPKGVVVGEYIEFEEIEIKNEA